MSMTSVSLSCAIRPARSGGSSGGAAARAAAACRGGGGVHNTFGAGAVPATPRTPGVPQPSSSPEAATPRVTGSNAREAGTLRPGTSGGRVAYRASIVLCAKGLGRGRGSHYTHTPRRSWTIPCREERRHVGAPRPPGGSGGTLRGGRRGETATRASRRAAAGGPVAPVRREGSADQKGATGDRPAQR